MALIWKRAARALVWGFAGIAQVAGAGEIDKSGHTLFNPTPRDQMRELSTDRPDKTESPYTVDAGHFQVETDIFVYSYDRDGLTDQTQTSSAWAFSNFKVGLTSWSDLQVFVLPFQTSKTETAGEVQEFSGFGDMAVRLKFNLLGNDGGAVALGVMPFVKLPTAKDGLGTGKVDAGLIVPVCFTLSPEWSLGMMAQFNRYADPEADLAHIEVISTASIGRSIYGELSGYLEFFSLINGQGQSEWVATVDGGLTYGLTPDLQLDAGVNVGVTDAAPDVNPFVGISARY